MRAHHWAVAGFTGVAVIAFYVLLFTSAKTIGSRYGQWFQEIEASGPP
jgi:succinate dehydrogenase hydrophobic anchor subunit